MNKPVPGSTKQGNPGESSICDSAQMDDLEEGLPLQLEQDDGTPKTTASGVKHRLLIGFDAFASGVTRWTGSPLVFALASASVLIWAVTGPIFNYSETWQLIINTGTTIVTFLMVFLIQQSQNKDSQAIHLKLDELLHAMANARNEMIDIEHLTEMELKKLAEQFKRPSL